MNIFSNYIPSDIIIDDKDPPWMTKAIKNKINSKNPYVSQKFHEITEFSI